jgi:hypothetical protein
MTQDEIIEMAKKAGFGMPWLSHEEHQAVFAFAKLVRNDYSNKHAQLWLKRIDDAVKAEREAVLDLVDAYAKNNTDLADAIRARSCN